MNQAVSARFSLVPAAYLILLRDGDQGQEVLLQRRCGTGYMDGWWACAAAGHVEAGESALDAAVREADEELGITIGHDDPRPVTTVHRGCLLPDPLEQRIDLFFMVRRWAGDPAIQEPEKAAELRWFALEALPERVVPHERLVLDQVAADAEPIPAILTHGFAQHLTLVAAVGADGSLGDGENMPWHLPEDLAHFKRTTIGGVMVMGRGTWDSIGQALPGRRTIVVTRNRGWSAPGAEVAHSLPEALLIAGDQELFVAGGGQIYAQTIAHASRLVITEVEQTPGSSVRFPAIDPAHWREVARDPREGLSFVTYERR